MKRIYIFILLLLNCLGLNARDMSGGALILNNTPWYLNIKIDRPSLRDTHINLLPSEAYQYDSKIDIRSIHVIAYKDEKQEAIADALSFYEDINIKYMGTVNIITFLKGANGLIMHRLGPDGDNNKAKMHKNTKFPKKGTVVNK